MSSYVIAGKADDPVFARLEHMAKGIETTFPGISFHFEMKHPPAWNEFIQTVYRKYDFQGYSSEFPGPLVWTHEGRLIGGATEFLEQVCMEKLGMAIKHETNDAAFKRIAMDNLLQVKKELQRKTDGPAFSEIVDSTLAAASAAGLVHMMPFDEKRLTLKPGGARLETWISKSLGAERAGLHSEFGNGESARIGAGLLVGTLGAEESHVALLHPRPLANTQLCLVKNRLVKRLQETSELEVPPDIFGRTPDDDLAFEDFHAATDALLAVGGVATWMGLSCGGGYRHPLDTHLQILGLPFGQVADATGPCFPLELCIERAAQQKGAKLAVMPFKHTLIAVDGGDTPKGSELAEKLRKAFETARAGSRCSCAVAFTSKWLLYVPLVTPPEPSDLLYETWLKIPPPPPCALIGVVVAEAVDDYVQTCGLGSNAGSQLVTNRAALEGIPETSAAYDAARREPRVNPAILDDPMALLGFWARA